MVSGPTSRLRRATPEETSPSTQGIRGFGEGGGGFPASRDASKMTNPFRPCPESKNPWLVQPTVWSPCRLRHAGSQDDFLDFPCASSGEQVGTGLLSQVRISSSSDITNEPKGRGSGEAQVVGPC